MLGLNFGLEGRHSPIIFRVAVTMPQLMLPGTIIPDPGVGGLRKHNSLPRPESHGHEFKNQICTPQQDEQRGGFITISFILILIFLLEPPFPNTYLCLPDGVYSVAYKNWLETIHCNLVGSALGTQITLNSSCYNMSTCLDQ